MEQPSPEIVAALSRTTFCDGLDPSAVARMAREGMLVTFHRGEQVFAENSDANRLYLVLQGVIRIETRPPRADGAGLILDHMSEGRVFGEMGLIDEQPRSAAAICEEDAVLFTLTRADMARLSESDPLTVCRLYRNLGRELAQKLRGANEEMREIRAFTGGPDPELAELAGRLTQAQRLFRSHTQEQVDRLVQATAQAALDKAEELAALAVDETAMGVIRDKVTKIRFAARTAVESWAGIQTAGVLTQSEALTEILEPAGPVCLVMPEANPTAATILHALLCLKTRNAAVLVFPSRSLRCGIETARVIYNASLRAGAPEHWLSWVQGTVDHRRTLELVRRPEVHLVVVSGRPAIARSLAISGKPLLADGSGCTPCYVHADADPAAAASDIVFSKTFDHGSSLTGEQVILAHEAIAAELIGELALRGATFLGEEARAPLTSLLFPAAPREDGEPMVGRPAVDVARLADLPVSSSTTLLVVRLSDVGPAEPLAGQKLCPVVGFLQVANENEALRLSRIVLEHGGEGLTAVVHTRDPALATHFGAELPVLRMLVNSPATQGAWGGLVTTLPPSLTLGGGSAAGSFLADNLGPRHLLQVRRVAWRRDASTSMGEAQRERRGRPRR
jgi:acetaldehyde dehydrogenase/alcohol dehydrogenase